MKKQAQVMVDNVFFGELGFQEYRPRIRALYYDPSKYDNYLEQLGIQYPTVH
ncbi:MAG TPA: hypothetical protein VG297_08040 [Bryobacteraceae bacterium]|jgi:hypothetical protein|nr:hypothetical protein [Bryobacteraceae bacterium]